MARELERTPLSELHPPVHAGRRRLGHWEQRTVRRQGAKAPFQQRFYVTEKEVPSKRKKLPDLLGKLGNLRRRLDHLLRTPKLPPKVMAQARRLQEHIAAILAGGTAVRTAALPTARKTPGRAKRTERRAAAAKSDRYSVLLP